MHPVLFQIGDIAVRSYSVLILFAVIIPLYLTARAAVRKGISKEIVLRCFFYAVIPMAVFGRLFHFVLFEGINSFLQNPIAVFYFWGSFSGQGIVLGVILTSIWMCKERNISYWKFLDIVMPHVALAEAIWKLGCFLNGCCYGVATNLPWGIVFPTGSRAGSVFVGQPIHPAQLYMSLASFIVFIILYKLSKKNRHQGYLFGVYLIIQPLLRFAIEFSRADYNRLWGTPLNSAQILCLVTIIIGFPLLVLRLRPQGVSS